MHQFGFLLFVIIIVIIILLFRDDSKTNKVLKTKLIDSKSLNAKLEGKNEVPPVKSRASGIGSFRLFEKTLIRYQVNIIDLKCPLADVPGHAHIHSGGPGENGPVVKTLASPTFSNGIITLQGTWSTTDKEQPLTPELLESMIKGELYVNIHTTKYPDGELRGQIIPVEH